MGSKRDIPEVVVRRLPKYYRCLKEMERENVTRISSNMIAKRLNITASQVRQDFSHYGGFGHQGYGYDVSYLKNEIKEIIGLNREYNVVIVGAGHIGQALMNYSAFSREGFFVKAAFDVDVVGKSVPDGVELLNVTELCSYAKTHKIDICALAVQKENARAAMEQIKLAGIPAVWNFTPAEFAETPEMVVENINMNDSLFTLAYMLSAAKN